MRLNPLAVPLRGTRPPYRTIQNPSGRPRIEVSGHASEVRNTPAAQILIERRGSVEHVFHPRGAADVPRTDVLIERRGAHEENPAIRPRSSSHPLRVNRAC